MDKQITPDEVREKKGGRCRGFKKSPGRKIRNPKLEAYALNFVREHIFSTGKLGVQILVREK